MASSPTAETENRPGPYDTPMNTNLHHPPPVSPTGLELHSYDADALAIFVETWVNLRKDYLRSEARKIFRLRDRLEVEYKRDAVQPSTVEELMGVVDNILFKGEIGDHVVWGGFNEMRENGTAGFTCEYGTEVTIKANKHFKRLAEEKKTQFIRYSDDKLAANELVHTIIHEMAHAFLMLFQCKGDLRGCYNQRCIYNWYLSDNQPGCMTQGHPEQWVRIMWESENILRTAGDLYLVTREAARDFLADLPDLEEVLREAAPTDPPELHLSEGAYVERYHYTAGYMHLPD